MRRWSWSLAAVMGAFVAGCGGEGIPKVGTLYPAKGKVTLPDGKPAGHVKVVFTGPVTNNVTTETDGTFAFKGDGTGLPAGDYKVRLEIIESKGTLKKPTLPFPSRYTDEDASGLTVVVKPEGPNDFDFKLEKEDGESHGPARAGGGPAKVND